MPRKSLFYGLPDIPRWKIIRLMDYESKYQLGRCSKRTFCLIDSIIFPLDLIILKSRIGCMEIEISTNFDDPLTHYIFSKRDDENCERNIDGCKSIIRGDFMKTALMELRKIFCYKNARIRRLNIEENFKNGERKKLINGIANILSSIGHQLSVKFLELFSCGSGDFSLGFLPFLKPEVLERIIFFSGKRTELHILKDIVELEQWKKVQSVYICHDQLDVPVENIKHLSYYHNERQKTSMEIKTIIENYFESKSFVRGRFKCHENPFNSDFDLPFHFNPSTQLYIFQKGEYELYARITSDGSVCIQKHIADLVARHVIYRQNLLLRGKCYLLGRKVPYSCVKYAWNLLDYIHKDDVFKEESRQVKVATCVWFAGYYTRASFSINDVSSVFGVPVEEIRKFLRMLKEWLNEVPAQSVMEICGFLGLSESFQEIAVGIARKATAKRLFFGRNQFNTAAATIYMTTKVSSEKRTIIEIGEKTRTGVASNLKLFEIMWAEKAELLPE
ncbi:hypothetical protein CRE_08093 [Caenorhabditis remanei]|uniref:F-box domain-containing protein n=1 Tax=Caenorhabditis remanei TaxID=31234 RepID=E3M3C7_CAERE|nr:hypothetical protein CRE_08093 [Caenorhabditis remanei]